jgi:DNA-nicking Smr family endonuclease
VRQLSPEEAALWARVTATIQPLSREKIKLQEPEKEQQYSAVVQPARQPRLRPAPADAPARPRLGTTLDSSWDRRLRSGAAESDRVLDLHGMTLDSAWRAIDRVLEQAINAGDRIVLLITGHHRPGEPPVERGRIRAAVHDWLAASRHARSIAAVRGAHRRHGGGGSLYIILRRR